MSPDNDLSGVSRISTKARIREYQSFLQRAGYYFGAIDGDWGPLTQRAHELYEHSKLDPQPVTKGNVKLITSRIIETAVHFLNLTEKSQNAVWDDVATSGPDARAAELRQKLLATGWQLGWAYCAAFAEVCWREGYKGFPELALIGQSITSSVMGTFENFQELGRITKLALPGSIMLMQKGRTWKGHAGIVVERGDNDVFYTIEGNTSQGRGTAEQQRNGDGVYRKRHTLNFEPSSGLWLRGFVNPFLVK